MPENPKDQPKPDQPPIEGGPGDVAPAAEGAARAETPQTVKVSYGGKEYAVAPEIASAWEARDRDYQQRFSQQGNELGELRRFRESVAQTVQPVHPQEPDLDVLMFQDPRNWRVKFKEQIKNEVRQEYMQDQNLKTFWQSFYRKHDDLEGEEALVTAIMQRHYKELEPLQTSVAQDKIADLTRSEIIRISKKLKGGTEQELPQGRAIVEGVSSETPRRRPPAEEEAEAKSISSVIRARRRQRLNPQAPKE